MPKCSEGSLRYTRVLAEFAGAFSGLEYLDFGGGFGLAGEQRDFLAADVMLPKAEIGDIIVLGEAGSSCAVLMLWRDRTIRHTGRG